MQEEKKATHFVYLTEEAQTCKELKVLLAVNDVPFCFECTKAEESGYFLRMTVINSHSRDKTFDLWLPVRFVLFVASREVKGSVGYGPRRTKDDDPSS